MSNPSLVSVAYNVVGQYSQFGKLVVGAYRYGAERAVIGANTRYVSLLNSGMVPLVTDNVKAALLKVQVELTGLVEDGITAGSNRAEQAIDFVVGGVNGGIQRVAAVAGRVEQQLDTQALSKVGQVAILPVAQVSLKLATRTVDLTKRLSARVAGTDAKLAPVVEKAQRVVRKAVRRTKARA